METQTFREKMGFVDFVGVDGYGFGVGVGVVWIVLASFGIGGGRRVLCFVFRGE